MPSDSPPFEVEFYRDPSGEKPVATWLRRVAASNPDLAERCKAALRRLVLDPAFQRSPHTRAIGDDLLELRILGSDGARILYFYAAERRIIIVHAFVKKTQKTPEAERRTAIRAMQAWRQDQSGTKADQLENPR